MSFFDLLKFWWAIIAIIVILAVLVMREMSVTTCWISLVIYFLVVLVALLWRPGKK